MIAIGVDLVQFVDVTVVGRERRTLVAAAVHGWRGGRGLGLIVRGEIAERRIAGGSSTVRSLGLLIFGSVDVVLTALLTKCFLVFPEEKDEVFRIRISGFILIMYLCSYKLTCMFEYFQALASSRQPSCYPALHHLPEKCRY